MPLPDLLHAIERRLTYVGQLINLRCLEISLEGKRRALAEITDPATRAEVAKSLQPLFLEVAFATNRVLKLRSVTTPRRSWRSA